MSGGAVTPMAYRDLNTDSAMCPSVTCDACPAGGCRCAPCGCGRCRQRARRATRIKTPLRSAADTPLGERLFEPEPTPILDRARAES